MSSLRARSRFDQPTSERWENEKETLRQLYLIEGRPLKEVIEIMTREHEFKATDKMYKYHFKRWNFRKSLTQDREVNAIVGRAIVLPFSAHGRELGSQRLKTRIMKVPYTKVDYDMHPELAISAIVNHSRARLQSWDLSNYQPGTTATETWASVACLAAHAISNGQAVGANYKILSRAAADFPSIFRRGEPTLLWSTSTIILQLYEVHDRLAISFIRVVAEFCSTQLHQSDPLNAVWGAMLRVDPSQIPHLIARLTATQLDFLREETEITNTFVMQYIKLSAKYLHDRGLITANAAYAQIDSIIMELHAKLQSGADTSASAKNSLISASLSKAYLYLDHREYEKVNEILHTIEPEIQAPLRVRAEVQIEPDVHGGLGIERDIPADFGIEPKFQADYMIDPAQMVNFYEVRAQMLMERGDYIHSEEYYTMALKTAKQRLSETMPGRIGYCFLALRDFYERAENTDARKEVQARYNEYLELMAGDDANRLALTETNIHRTLSSPMDQFSDGLSTTADQLSDVFSQSIDQVSDVSTNITDQAPDVFPCLKEQISDDSSNSMDEVSNDLSNPMKQVSDVLSYLGPDQHMIEVCVKWELQDFVSRGLDGLQELATVLTITGQPDTSYLNSCENYIKSTWSRNSLIIGFFQAFVNSSLDFLNVTNEHTIFSSPELNVSATLGSTLLPKDPNRLAFRIKATKHHLVETCQCIMWLAATCRIPVSGSIHASVASIRKVGMGSFEIDAKPLRPLPSPGSEYPCCWLNMFDGGYVLAQGFPTPPREHGQGLELPLNIMIEQGMTFNAINHTINGQDCMILKGRYTALVPVHIEGLDALDQTNEVQWHLVGKRPALVPINGANPNESEDMYHLTDMEFIRTSRELTWNDIDEIDLGIIPIGSIQEISSKRLFVGYFPKAQILVGTDQELYDDLESEPRAEIVRGNVVQFGESISLTLGTNAATSGIFTLSAGTTITRSKFDPIPKQANALIADKLRYDRNKPHILYDTSKRIAWMIPEACLILYLIHYWAVLQSETSPLTPRSSDERGPNTEATGSLKTFMPFIKASSNAAKDAADSILREFAKPSQLPGHIRDQKNPEKLLYVRDIMNKMYEAIDTSVEHQSRKKPGIWNPLKRLGSYHDLWGYDLADVAEGREAPIKRVHIDKEQCGGWDALTDPNYRIVVLFGNNLGELIRYEANQTICNQWKSVPLGRDFLSADGGTLEYLQELDRRGRSSIFLVDKSSLILDHRQKVCQGKEWPCCNVALQLSLVEPKPIIRVERGTVVIVGNATGVVNTRGLGTMIRKRKPTSYETTRQERRRIHIPNHSQFDFSTPEARALYPEANRLENGSVSERSVHEGRNV